MSRNMNSLLSKFILCACAIGLVTSFTGCTYIYNKAHTKKHTKKHHKHDHHKSSPNDKLPSDAAKPRSDDKKPDSNSNSVPTKTEPPAKPNSRDEGSEKPQPNSEDNGWFDWVGSFIKG